MKKTLRLATSSEDPGDKAGWTVADWCGKTAVGRSSLYVEMATGRVQFVKLGRRTIVTTPPAQYLKMLAAARDVTAS